MDKFEDLPSSLHEKFLFLSEAAFDGIKNQEVILHTLPPDLFFECCVSTLWRRSSLLHLTLQEFFAAYYISHLREGGLELFRQYKQWNVVWRFVAGLTKFKYYEDEIYHDLLSEKHRETVSEFAIPLHWIHWLYEAQSEEYFHISKCFAEIDTRLLIGEDSSLDCYALSYCISAIPTGLCWNVSLFALDLNSISTFLCGLKTTRPSANTLVGSCE